jgi:hypothetical protein
MKQIFNQLFKNEQTTDITRLISNLSFFVGGEIIENQDHTRKAFSLLQTKIGQTVVNLFQSNKEALYLCKQLHYRTTIIDALGYPGCTKRSVYDSKRKKTASLRYSVEFRLRRSFYGIFTYELRNVYAAVTEGPFMIRKRGRIRSVLRLSYENIS